MLMGTGGNSGSQSSTLVIRGMATGEIDLKDYYKVMWKEMRVGIIVGVCLSVLNYFRIVHLDHNPPMVALTVCCIHDTYSYHSQADRFHASYVGQKNRNRPCTYGRAYDGVYH